MDALWVMHQRDIQIGRAAVGHSDVAHKEAIVPVVGGSRVMARRRRPTFMISEVWGISTDFRLYVVHGVGSWWNTPSQVRTGDLQRVRLTS